MTASETIMAVLTLLALLLLIFDVLLLCCRIHAFRAPFTWRRNLSFWWDWNLLASSFCICLTTAFHSRPPHPFIIFLWRASHVEAILLGLRFSYLQLNSIVQLNEAFNTFHPNGHQINPLKIPRIRNTVIATIAYFLLYGATAFTLAYC